MTFQWEISVLLPHMIEGKKVSAFPGVGIFCFCNVFDVGRRGCLC